MRALQTLPSAGAALVWGACAAMLIYNMAVAPFAYDWQFHLWSHHTFSDLVGVVRPAKRSATLRTVLDGSFQAAYAAQLGARLPVFPGAVRLRNQIDYSVFGLSATPDVVVGAQDELVEHDYIADYCTRDLASFLPAARVWAGQIRQMQDAVEAQGKTFLYLLTPSKVAQYPEFLPAGWPCRSLEASRTGLVPAWLDLLGAAGVHRADTVAVVSALHGQVPFKLFPMGGTHWNAVAAALAGQAVAAALDGLRPNAGFAQLPFTWHMMDHPDGVDADIASLMNLLGQPRQQPVPAVKYGPGPTPPACPVRSIVMIGGSFGHAPNEYLSREPCHPAVVEYEYWHAIRIAWDHGESSLGKVDEAERTRSLAQADVVIYEENEQMLGHAEHGWAFYQYLTGRLVR